MAGRICELYKLANELQVQISDYKKQIEVNKQLIKNASDNKVQTLEKENLELKQKLVKLESNKSGLNKESNVSKSDVTLNDFSLGKPEGKTLSSDDSMKNGKSEYLKYLTDNYA